MSKNSGFEVLFFSPNSFESKYMILVVTLGSTEEMYTRARLSLLGSCENILKLTVEQLLSNFMP